MDDRRYYGLDALRGGMMMLGIVLHGATFYLVSPPATMPIPTDRNNAFIFDLLFHFIHSFRMPTFFVLAGWWMVQYDLPATIKFLCVTTFTTVICFVTYHYWVQRSWVSVFLNGRRFDLNWPWQAPRQADTRC